MERLVSIIVPVYKVEEYLDKCIESIVSQTYTKLEIILVDDGSPDSCPQRCDEWASRDERIIVIHKKNSGVGPARNSGLDVATGDYLMFVDSDDYISADAVEIMVERIENDQSDLVVAPPTKVYPDGSQNSAMYPWISDGVITKDAALRMMGSNKSLPVFVWGKLYRNRIFKGIRFESLKCAEDVYIWPDILSRCETVSLVEATIYFYFQRSTSTVHSKVRDHMIDNVIASLHISRFFLDSGCIEGARRYYCSAICQYYEMKSDKEAKRLLNEAFNRKERKMLRQGRDVTMRLAILKAKFPSVYKFYTLHIKNKPKTNI